MKAHSMPVERGGAADVVYVLCLMQAAFVLLGGLGEVLLMGGNPGYLGLPVAKAVLLFVVAAKIVSGRAWAMIALVVVQGVTLLGFWLQVAAGVLPWVDYTVNLAGLVTNLALPSMLTYLCVALFVRARSNAAPGASVAVMRPATLALPAARDPYAPAPLHTSYPAQVALYWGQVTR